MQQWIRGAVLGLAVSAVMAAAAQSDEVARANELYQAGKRLEALPLYEDLARPESKEFIYFERLADCLGAKAAQLSDAAQMKAVRIRERDAAKRAVELGDPAFFVQLMAKIDPDQPLFGSITGPGKALLTEAEKAYTAGDFQTAMDKYVAAAEVDPQLYEAPLYAGDTAFVQKDLAAASKWFARAIEVDPNRETAYRYWGDAILKFGNDPPAAREKFIDAIVAEPYNKLAWQGLRQWAKIEKVELQAPKIDRPAAPKVDADKPNTTNIVIDANSLDQKKNPYGYAWMMYSMVRATYHGDTFKKNFPDEKEYRHSLKEEDAALSVVASTVDEKKVKPEKLDESLRSLVMLQKAGMLDCWILIDGADDGIEKDYAAYRKDHRQLLHDYFDRFVIQGASPAQ